MRTTELPALKRFLLLTVLPFAVSGCTQLFYHPTDILYVNKPETLDGIRREIRFESTDGTKLSAWLLPSHRKDRRGTILQFHGNAQNMTSHFASVFWLTDEGYDVFTFDYRGYGISEGKPSQEGLNRDALAAIRYVAKGLRDRELVLYGQSLGGAVLLRALDETNVSERSKIRAIVIESSFHNYHEVARSALSRSWLTFLMQPLAYILVSNAYSPEDAIAHVAPIPLLVIHGDNDPVVPYRFGQKIYDLAGTPKSFLPIPGGTHIDSMMTQEGSHRKELLEFLDRAANRSGPSH